MFTLGPKVVHIVSAPLCAALISACQPGSTAMPPTLPPPTPTAVALTATPVPPTATSRPPTSTPVPPTATPVPPTATPAPSATPVGAIDTGPFAGRWSGTMYLGGDRDVPYATAALSIPAACAPQQACGELSSAGSGCSWELRLLGIDGDVLTYEFSRSLTRDDCTLGAGTLTLQADGRLVREHVIAGSDILSGIMRRLPSQP